MASILPNGEQTFTDDLGKPLAGGQVTFYIPGTSTYKTTWQDSAQTILNSNPVILDSAGRAIIYGEGSYRQIVQDQSGNTIWDRLTDAGSVSVSEISAAMLPVVGSSTIDAALTALGINPSLHSFLGQNDLLSAMNLLGSSGATFAGDVGITGAFTAKKMGATSLNMNPGDQSLTVAPTANEIATFSSLNVQGTTVSDTKREFLVSFGLNSNIGIANQPTGNDKVTLYVGATASPGTADLWTLNTCLTQTPGSGDYNCQGFELDFNNMNAHRGDALYGGGVGFPVSYGLSITGASQFRSTGALLITGSTQQWNRGILIANDCIRQHAIEDISSSPVTLAIAGSHTNGIETTQANFGTGAALFMANGQNVSWQNGATTISDTCQGSNRIIGAGATGVAFSAIPFPITSIDLGLSNNNNRWNNAYVNTLHYTTQVADSDPALKTSISPMPSMTDLITSIQPKSYKWLDQDLHGSDTHYGFLADEVKVAFNNQGLPFGGYFKDENGRQGLNYLELIGVLWQALKEVIEEVKELKK